MKTTTQTINLRDFLTDQGITHERKDKGGSIGITGSSFPSRLIYAAFKVGVTCVQYIPPGQGVFNFPCPLLYLTTISGGVFIEGTEDKTKL